MTVRYSDAQLQQQRDLPGAGVRRQAVDPQHIELFPILDPTYRREDQ